MRPAISSAARSRRERRGTSISPSAYCPVPAASRCTRFMRSCGIPTTWPMVPARAEEKEAALRLWQTELDAALAAEAVAWPGLLALADTVSRWRISPSLLNEVIEGVSMDVQPRPFASFDELADYCYHVASVVGLCCIHIWGYRSDGGRAERLAEACGIALQLTNILRDVREDARNGRVYLPQDEMARFGVEPRELDADRPSRGLHDLLAFQAQRACGLLRAGEGTGAAGRPGRPARAPDHRGNLPGLARRDRPTRLQRTEHPGSGSHLAKSRNCLAISAPAVPPPADRAITNSRSLSSEPLGRSDVAGTQAPPSSCGDRRWRPGGPGRGVGTCRSRPADHAPGKPAQAGRPSQLVH